jgi:5-methylcytosine-specific restriction endonuclease McrA
MLGYGISPRDHDYPISEASKDFIRTGIKRIYAIDNIYPLCIACNSRKHIRFIEHPKAKPKDLNTLYN